jgi:chemotaxis regulatin CheY-phosphate phosphatase CheZ
MDQTPDRRGYTDSDYEAILRAVEETARGRWFLAEHAKHTRHADTRVVLTAIEKLERAVAEKSAPPDFERVRLDLVDLANIIARTRSEIAAIQPEGGSNIGQATNELDAIVDTTERATSDILSSAEQTQEIAWTLRERGVDPAMCDQIDALVTEIYTACSFQDLTGQRIRKVIDALRFLERRLDGMIALWRNAPPVVPGQGPEETAAARDRGAIDTGDMLEPAPEAKAARKPAPPSADPAIEALSPSERLALFS